MPMEKEHFLEQFSKQALDERISLFLGAGGSCDAGYPTWSSLFEPLAKELKTTIDSSTDYIDILNNISADEVVIELADPSRAGVIVPVEQEENEDLLMLLMPMMLND